MKLLLENWRKYLNEDERTYIPGFGLTGKSATTPLSQRQRSAKKAYAKRAAATDPEVLPPETAAEDKKDGELDLNSTIEEIHNTFRLARKAETEHDRAMAQATLVAAYGQEAALTVLDMVTVGLASKGYAAVQAHTKFADYINNHRLEGKTVNLSDYPILDKVDIEPDLRDSLIGWFQKPFVDKLDEEYEKMLDKLPPNTQVKNFPTFSQFITEYIQDKSGGKISVSYTAGSEPKIKKLIHTPFRKAAEE